MRRYQFLDKEEIYNAFNQLRNAFLAAKDGEEVDKIIDGILTYDEKLKIGRRILIANLLTAGLGIEEITRQLRVGRNTVMHVARKIEKYQTCFDLIEERRNTVEREYKKKKYRVSGSSLLVFKKKEYTGVQRKNIKRK